MNKNTLNQIARLLMASAVLATLGCTSIASRSTAAQTGDLYADADAWLCKPGRQDLCSGETSIASLQTDGRKTIERLVPDPAAPIDCFYVYPTISDDPAGNSGLTPGPGERRAVEMQFAPFASVCRPFAPMYRQITLAGLISVARGNPLPMDRDLGYRDVVAAWKHYLAYDNQGRGVVLIGHSQGSRMLAELIQREIEGTPMQARIVSAVLPGFNVEVPAGQVTGGTFRQMPLCRSAHQVGCVTSYVTFRTVAPPPVVTRFGRTSKPGMTIACVDPVALSGMPLRSALPVRTNLLGQPNEEADWQQATLSVRQRFVSLPGMFEAACVRRDGASYLSVSKAVGARGAQPADIPGDVMFNGQALPDWGLHLVDVNLPMGNLLAIVRQQADAYVAAH